VKTGHEAGWRRSVSPLKSKGRRWFCQVATVDCHGRAGPRLDPRAQRLRRPGNDPAIAEGRCWLPPGTQKKKSDQSDKFRSLGVMIHPLHHVVNRITKTDEPFPQPRWFRAYRLRDSLQRFAPPQHAEPQSANSASEPAVTPSLLSTTNSTGIASMTMSVRPYFDRACFKACFGFPLPGRSLPRWFPLQPRNRRLERSSSASNLHRPFAKSQRIT